MGEGMGYGSLVSRLKNDDLTAFDEIYDLSKKAVYYAAYAILRNKESAEDVMQETYLKLLEKKKRLREDIDIVAYLVAMAKNAAFDQAKRSRREQLSEAEEDIGSHSEAPLDTGLVAKIRQILNPKEADVLLLRAISELTFKEISKLRGVPVGTLTWTYQEARRKVMEALGTT